jgi:guanylate kinase
VRGPASRPFPVVLAAPSGAGKTSLARALVARHADIMFSVSATTRPRRPGERDGHDYLFVDDAEFDRMTRDGELLEWAMVHDRRYGTPKSSVAEALERGSVVILDIDFQGARQVRAAFADAVMVYVLPPTAEELVRRLLNRGSEADAERRRRLITARVELAAVDEFDYLVVNDELEVAVASLEAIIRAERHRTVRAIDIGDRLSRLRNGLDALIQRSE